MFFVFFMIAFFFVLSVWCIVSGIRDIHDAKNREKYEPSINVEVLSHRNDNKWTNHQKAVRRREEAENEKYLRKIQGLEERMVQAESVTALMKSIRCAENFHPDECMLKANAWRFPNVNTIMHEGRNAVVNAFLQRKFDDLRDKALEPVSMSDFSKSAYALKKSIDAVFDDLPKQSQFMYAKYRKEVFGDD